MKIEELEAAYFEDLSGIEEDPDPAGKIVAFLKDQVGKPYQYGVNSSSTGNRVFDCSSLVQEAYKTIGVDMARTSVNQATYYGRPVEMDEELKPGDLLFFTGEYGYYNPQYPMGIGHVATYVGEGRAIHTQAWFDDKGEEHGIVIEESLEELMERRADIAGVENDLAIAKRVFEAGNYYHEGFSKQLP